MDFKKSNAPASTITRDVRKLEAQTGNIYETISVIGKRANQISAEMKEELDGKLEEFSSKTDTLEEVYENVEQIEISKMYERLPKPASIAVQEFIDGKVYYRMAEAVVKTFRSLPAKTADLAECEGTTALIFSEVNQPNPALSSLSVG